MCGFLVLIAIANIVLIIDVTSAKFTKLKATQVALQNYILQQTMRRRISHSFRIPVFLVLFTAKARIPALFIMAGAGLYHVLHFLYLHIYFGGVRQDKTRLCKIDNLFDLNFSNSFAFNFWHTKRELSRTTLLFLILLRSFRSR